MDKTKWNEIQVILLCAAAILLFISFITYDPGDIALFTSKPNSPVKNLAGLFGAYIGGMSFFIMGLSAYALPMLLLTWALARFYNITPQKLYLKAAGTAFLILASSSLFSMLVRGDNTARFRLGGATGLVFSDLFVKYLGRIGAILVIAVLFLLSILLATEFLLLPFLSNAVGLIRDAYSRYRGRAGRGPGVVLTVRRPQVPRQEREARPAGADKKEGPREASKKAAPGVKRDIEISIAASQKSFSKTAVSVQGTKTPSGYKLPGFDLLDLPPPIESRKIKEDFEENAAILEETLRDFDIESKVVAVNRGPVITRYELEPAPGVKIHKITSLSDNIALAMKAQSVRIVAPIPGKGTIGVEVPNSISTIVYLREVLDSKEFKESGSRLKLALGKDIAGAPVIADLAGMPHLLIAGATGSGKTVCINSIITSLLFTYSPDDVRFIMVDPKRVELAVFNDLPHLLSPIVTEPKKVANTLHWVVSEMDSRYELFARMGVRNIDLYNERVTKAQTTNNELQTTKLPYIIVIIDELADLMMLVQQEVESAITRLAQLSRAVGIHIIIATQRPSVDVITGVIKANFPARISFKVASKVDSRTVLDMNGADKLLGRGDMLFVEPGASKPVRAQSSLISDKEIERITDFIKSQGTAHYVPEILDEQKRASFKKFDKDEVYEEAVRTILESRQASVSILQRRLGLGYTRAARLIDMMEDEGIVGPYQGSKPRDILVSLEEYQAKDGK